MANSILGTRSPNGPVGVRGVADSGELSALTAGVLSGFDVNIGSGFSLTVGGSQSLQDVAVVKNSAGESDLLVGNGNRMIFALPNPPATSGQSQEHALVVWKDSTVASSVNDGLDAVGYQVVSGVVANSPSAPAPPTDAQVRAAIPNGSTAFYAIIATCTLTFGDTAPLASRVLRLSARQTSRLIINGTDLNSIKSVGRYAPLTGASNVATLSNLPLSISITTFWLDVSQFSDGVASSVLCQEFTAATAPMRFIRISTNGGDTWTQWRNTGNEPLGVYANSTPDINTIGTSGTYSIRSTAVANIPILQTGILEVFRLNEESNTELTCAQRFTVLNSGIGVPRVFVRNSNYSQTGWYPWEELVSGTVDLVSDVIVSDFYDTITLNGVDVTDTIIPQLIIDPTRTPIMKTYDTLVSLPFRLRWSTGGSLNPTASNGLYRLLFNITLKPTQVTINGVKYNIIPSSGAVSYGQVLSQCADLNYWPAASYLFESNIVGVYISNQNTPSTSTTFHVFGNLKAAVA